MKKNRINLEDTLTQVKRITAETVWRFFGIFWIGKNNEIVYYTAAENFLLNEQFITAVIPLHFKKGDYCGIMLKDWCKAPDLVSITFKKLLNVHGLDPYGYCLEIYNGNNDMECFVKLKD